MPHATLSLSLSRLEQPVGEQYMQALREVGGASAPDLDEAALSTAFLKEYNRASLERPCFGHGLCDSNEWWQDVVHSTFASAGLPPSSAELLPDAFTLLWHRFSTRDGFRLRPHVLECLSKLHAWREAQPDGRTRIAVISNWDDRLPMLLRELGVVEYFDAVITSREVGFEKPDARIFALARARMAVAPDARCVHIGDSWSRDVRGAHAAAYEAVYVRPRAQVPHSVLAEMSRGDAAPHLYLEDLASLPDRLLPVVPCSGLGAL